MNKIALCFFGQPRFYNSDSYDCIKRELLDKYDVDVFVHTWFKKGYQFPCAPWSSLGDIISLPDNAIDDIKKLYNPKKILVEEPNSVDFSKYDICLTNNQKNDYLAKNMPSMFYSIYRSHLLMQEYATETNTKYEFVVKLRLDHIIYNIPKLSTLKQNILYVQYMDFLANRGLITDNFSIADYNTSIKASELYLSLTDYKHLYYVPEDTFTDYIRRNRICVNELKFITGFIRKWKIM